MKKIRWGILGAGGIARAYTAGLAQSATGELVAVASRSRDKAEAFVQQHAPQARACAPYDELLKADDIDAVYISTLHPWHREAVFAALEAGKPVVCEKPLGMDAADVEAMTTKAREAGLFLMEGFMYRCHPQTRQLVEVLQSGKIGQPLGCVADFSFEAWGGPEGRLLNPALGGGAILDVGCYVVSFARLVAGTARGTAFAEPEVFTGHAVCGETGADVDAAAALRFEGGFLAQVSCGLRARKLNEARVYGTEGWLHIPQPFILPREDKPWAFTFHAGHGWNGEAEEIGGDSGKSVFAWEADIAGEGITAGVPEAPSPAMNHADSLGNARCLDRWLALAR